MTLSHKSLVLASAAFAALFGAQTSSADEGLKAINGEGVRVNILSLKRGEGDTVTLRWEIVNDGRGDFSMTTTNERLLDLPGRRRYDAGLGSNDCRAETGKRVQCWAMYAAPPASAKTMAVQFYERFDLIPGVPVTD